MGHGGRKKGKAAFKPPEQASDPSLTRKPKGDEPKKVIARCDHKNHWDNPAPLCPVLTAAACTPEELGQDDGFIIKCDPL